MISSVKLVVGSLLAMLTSAAFALEEGQSRYNFQPPVTRVAREIFDLHMIMLWICVAIFVIVFGVMFYSIWKHRKAAGYKAAQFHEHTGVEIAWTVIPLIILIAMAWPATRVVLDMKDTSAADITIKATGYQWKWGYDYLKGEGEGIAMYSNLATPRDQIDGVADKGTQYLLEVDKNLVVPVGKKVRMLTTANDVIHSWWVPAFGAKQDAVPGFVRDTWFKAEKEGVYRGQCVELCGKDHGFMPIVVEVVSAEKYALWVSGERKRIAAAAEDPTKVWALGDIAARGEKIYAGNCVACHQATGLGIAGNFPALAGSAKVNGDKGDVIQILLNGVVKDGKQTAMASFKQLSDTDIAAVITYTRNNWSNKVGDVIQPTDVKAARK